MYSSPVQLFVTPGTVALQAPLSMGFTRQEHWSGLPFPSTGDLPNLGMEPEFPASPTLAGRFFTSEPPGKPHIYIYNWKREINKYTMSMKCHIIQTSPTIQFGVQNFCGIWK